jgi:hypothetical protein
VTFSIFSYFLHIEPVVFKPPNKAVILRGCDFLDLFVLLHIQPAALQAPRQSRHPERSASRIYRKQRALWRGVEEPVPSVAEGTPAMLLCRCSWEFSARKLHRKIKKSQTPDRSGVEWRDLLFFPPTLISSSVTFSLRHYSRTRTSPQTVAVASPQTYLREYLLSGRSPHNLRRCWSGWPG